MISCYLFLGLVQELGLALGWPNKFHLVQVVSAFRLVQVNRLYQDNWGLFFLSLDQDPAPVV
jgi:hypothetical protein